MKCNFRSLVSTIISKKVALPCWHLADAFCLLQVSIYKEKILRYTVSRIIIREVSRAAFISVCCWMSNSVVTLFTSLF